LIIETLHLRILTALDQHGTLTEAADRLFLSQSALSHQIRQLEHKLGTPVWEKAGRRLRLTPAGDRLLEAARRVLPLLEQTERTLKAYAEGKQGVLRIGVECYPCYEWLTGVVNDFLTAMPQIDLDILHQLDFSGVRGLREREIDLLITPDRGDQPLLHYTPLFDYELVLAVAASHPLAAAARVEPAQLAGETLLSFPVADERLDLLTRFLWPAGVRPLRHQRVASMELMLQLVAHGRGVCALPRWLVDRFREPLALVSLSLGRGIQRSLFAAVRREERSQAPLSRFVELGRRMPS